MGSCKCGNSDSCVGNITGSFCDSSNNKCKCAQNVDACKNGQTCNDGQCKGIIAIHNKRI